MTQLKTRKSLKVFVFVVLIGAISQSLIFSEEPFAPKVDPPKNMTNRDFWVKMAETWNIPGQSEVGFPAYPGAKIASFKAASKMTANGVEYQTLPAMILVAPDEKTAVTAFYKEQLKDWQYKNSYGMFDVFWTGGEFNSMDVTDAATKPNVIVQDVLETFKEMMPDAKCQIQIVYNPYK
jgi:hypothetical protein